MTRLLAVLVLALMLVTSCVSEPNQPVSDDAGNVQWTRIGSASSVAHIQIDGIDCVVYDGQRAGGISCDWSQG